MAKGSSARLASLTTAGNRIRLVEGAGAGKQRNGTGMEEGSVEDKTEREEREKKESLIALLITLFGPDAEKMLKEGKISEQTCLAKSCNQKFWLPYGRHYAEGKPCNRGTCELKCEAAYQQQLKEVALAREAAFLAKFGLS